MKLGPVTKLDKRDQITSKKFDEDVMSKDCNVIAIFSIYNKSEATPKPDSAKQTPNNVNKISSWITKILSLVDLKVYISFSVLKFE